MYTCFVIPNNCIKRESFFSLLTNILEIPHFFRRPVVNRQRSSLPHHPHLPHLPPPHPPPLILHSSHH